MKVAGASEDPLVQTEEAGTVSPVPAREAAGGTPLVDLPLPRRLTAFGFLLVAEFFYGWAWNTVDVLRPLFRASLGLTLTQAGSAYSAQGAGALLGALSIGQLADRLGKRNMLVVVMAGYGLMLLAGTLVTSYATLLLQRFVLGLFLGGSFPVVVGIYVELFRATLRGKLASAINATFSLAIVTLGFLFGHLGGRNWHLLLWAGGVPPLVLAGFAYVLVPASARGGVPSSTTKLPIAELFTEKLRRQTLLLATMTGLNFFAYQAFSGWVTTYLLTVRHLPALDVGRLLAAQFSGNILGGFFWGWLSDRRGRRMGALGFFVAAAAIVAFLNIPGVGWLLLLGAIYGFCLASSVIWGPWLAELYPPHLKSTASSIFNWGRLVSFFSPILTGLLAQHFGLSTGMLVSSVVFTVAACIWLTLPETLPVLARK